MLRLVGVGRGAAGSVAVDPPCRVLIEGNVLAWYTATRGRSIVSTPTLGPP